MRQRLRVLATPFAVSVFVGLLVTLVPVNGVIRVMGLASGLILFAWIREHLSTPRAAYAGAIAMLAVVTVGALLLVHIAAPFLRLDRVPPLGLLAGALEPLGLYRLLVADPAALQRFRLYASGLGALAAVGLAMTTGLALATTGRRRLVLLALGALVFGLLLVGSDNRGSMLGAALAVGGLVVWWRPRLVLLAALLVFGTLDLIALGLAPLLEMGQTVEYYTTLQVARLYRLDGRLDLAQQTLARTREADREAQYELERALLMIWRAQVAPAEDALRWVIAHPSNPPQPEPDGDDPRYWLAVVQARQGRHAEALATARAGLAALPTEQASLRAPYHLLLGESLLTLGKADEALMAFQVGQRLAPGDARFAEGIGRARVSQP